LIAWSRLLCAGDDFNLALIFVELHSSVAESEQSVVAAATNVVAGTETGAALTDDDGTGAHSFAAEGFDTEKLGITVATVAAAGLTFFMSHDNTSNFMLIVLNCKFTSYKISPKYRKIKSQVKKKPFFLDLGWKNHF
jgi:hypothetical protein